MAAVLVAEDPLLAGPSAVVVVPGWVEYARVTVDITSAEAQAVAAALRAHLLNLWADDRRRQRRTSPSRRREESLIASVLARVVRVRPD